MEKEQFFLNEMENLIVEFDKKFSSKMIMDECISKKLEEKIETFIKNCEKYEDEEEKIESQRYYINRYNELVKLHNISTSDLESICQECEEQVEGNCMLFDIESAIKEKSIWGLAVQLAYEKYHTEEGISNAEEWKKSLSTKDLRNTSKSYNSIEYKCREVYSLLYRIHENILPIYLNAIGIYDYTSITQNKKKDKASLDDSDKEYIKPDILFLLSCFFSFMCDIKKKWKSKEINEKVKMIDADYGRSFLKKGNGILRYMLRESLIRRYARLLYLDVKGRELKNTLFVFPRSIYQELFWNTTINFEELCTPIYAKTVRFVMSEYIKKELNKKESIIDEAKLHKKSILDYKKTSYSMVDELYWILQFQQMEDLVSGLDGCLSNTKLSSLKFDMIAMLDQICIEFEFPAVFDSETSEKTNLTKELVDRIALETATWFIMNNFTEYKKDSLGRSYRRHREDLDKLYLFYEQGTRCLRNTGYYFDDFQQVAFFEPMSDRCDFVQSDLRKTYVKGMLAVIFIVLGWEKVFPIESSGNEENTSLCNIIKTYAGKQVDDVQYAMNGTYYLLWNCLNEILEWGFQGAKIINDFRRYVFLEFCRNAGIGLKDDKESVEPISMDCIRKQVFLDYDEWLYDTGTCVKDLMYRRMVFDRPFSREMFGSSYAARDMASCSKLGSMSFSEIFSELASNPGNLPKL